MLAIIAVHEGRHDHRAVGLAQLVLHRAAHAEHLGVEVVGGLDVALAQDAVAQALIAGDEAPEHGAARMERPEGHHLRAVENLGRVAARIVELEQAQHAPLVTLGGAGEAVRNLGGFQLGGHFLQLVRTRHAPADVGHVVLVALVQHEAVVPVVQAQVFAIALAGVVQFHADDFGGKTLPRRHVGDVEAHVTQLGNLDHSVLSAVTGLRRNPSGTGVHRITPRRRAAHLTQVRPAHRPGRCTGRAGIAYPADRPSGKRRTYRPQRKFQGETRP